MKAHVLFFLLLSVGLSAQRVVPKINIGIGNFLSDKHPQGKANLGLQLTYILNKSSEISLEAGFGGDLFPTSDNYTQDVMDSVMIITGSAKYNFLLLEYDFIFLRNESRAFYTSLNAGYAKSFITAIEFIDVAQFNSKSFSYGFGAGVRLGDFDIGLKYQYLGKFQNQDIVSDDTSIHLPYRNLNLIQLSITYQFEFK